jgi:hypothetical protein
LTSGKKGVGGEEKFSLYLWEAKSKMDLVDIPDEIAELQYVTVVQNDVVKTASLQLYLYSNQIQELCSSLFKLRNLTVLSLRKFYIRFFK